MAIRVLPDIACQNPRCQRQFRPAMRRTRFCSLSCAGQWRSQTGVVQRGARAAQATLRRRRLEQAQAKVQGLTPAQAYWLGRNENLSATWKRGDRHGFTRGYEQALRDVDPSYARQHTLLNAGQMRKAKALEGRA